MDRNQAIGLLLIFLMLTVYFQFFTPEPTADNSKNTQTEQKNTQEEKQKTVDKKLEQLPDSVRKLKEKEIFGDFANFATGTEKEYTLENKDLQIIFSSKGGKIKQVILKNYKDQHKEILKLIDAKNSQMNMFLQSKDDKEIALYEMYFDTEEKSNSLVFKLKIADNQYIEQTYTLAESGFQLGYDFKIEGMDNILKDAPVRFTWLNRMQNTEPDAAQTRIKTTINYYTASGVFDYLSESSLDYREASHNEPLLWVSMKQKFFTSAFIAKNKNIESCRLKQEVDNSDENTLKVADIQFEIPLADLKEGKGNFEYYFGTTRYYTIAPVAEGFYENVDLGWPLIEYFSMFVIVPLFAFLEGSISNYGLIITLLVLIVKLALFPLSYRSYISMAKMKVLKPEIDEIKAANPNDTQKVQQEQMKLYQQVGINPLSGCIPLLLQLPVLLAMFSFFPNAIELRQEGFLWATDLSNYDSIATLPFAIPFYGTHVSLFTILMTISTLGLTWINNQNTPNIQPEMKMMGYVMPVVFMFILNTFPAGLSYYYLLSNVISIAQQLIIRRMVDETKIRAVLEQNKEKNKTKKKSGFMQKLENAMQMQQEKQAKTLEAQKNKKPKK